MNSFSHVPPGFRFHPTDEELVDYYLRKKVASKRIDLDIIKDIDLYRIEPWDLKELCRIGTEERNEWYFFSHKDKKYPTGTRTNRATKAGFWKATGRDKAIYSKHSLIGMRKTLVFYEGRAPNGQKSDWIMHEYRLETNENGTSQEEGWVVCRVFMKKMLTTRKEGEHESLCWYDDQVTFMPDFNSPGPISQPYTNSYQPHYTCKQELELQYNMPHDAFLQLPELESPKVPQSTASSSIIPYGILQSSILGQEENMHQNNQLHVSENYSNDQVTDWRVLDKFVASQFSQDDARNDNAYSNEQYDQVSDQMSIMHNDLKAQNMAAELASVSTSSSQVDPLLWRLFFISSGSRIPGSKTQSFGS